MRHGCRLRRDFVRTWLFLVGLVCGGGVAFAQTATGTGSAASAANAWATGGVPGPVAAVPYCQAPPLPAAVIQGGTIPSGWTPQAVPYQGLGPDGRPLTMYYAPTYVFTYPIGPPMLATAIPSPSRVNRKQAVQTVPQPVTMQGWPSQPSGVGAAPTLPPATVARYQPVPYQFAPGSRQLSGTPIVPPAGPPPGAVAAMPIPSATPVPPPPTQWAPAVDPSPAAGATQVAPPMAPLHNGSGDGSVIAAPIIAGAAAATTPPPPLQEQRVIAQPASAQPSSSPVPQPAVSSSSRHTWRVVGVHDGDTITCLDEWNQQQKVRLAEIDAPEIGQDYGKVSREALADLVFGKTVDVSEEGKDRYGRWIGHVALGSVDVNRQMVASGNAWHYTDYSRDAGLEAAQTQARSQRLGLWSQPNPTPPWDFRRSSPN